MVLIEYLLQTFWSCSVKKSQSAGWLKNCTEKQWMNESYWIIVVRDYCSSVINTRDRKFSPKWTYKWYFSSSISGKVLKNMQITDRSQPEVRNSFDDFIPSFIYRLSYLIILLFNFQNCITSFVINLLSIKHQNEGAQNVYSGKQSQMCSNKQQSTWQRIISLQR